MPVKIHQKILIVVFLNLLVGAPFSFGQTLKDLFEQAGQYFYEGNYEEAIIHYEKIIEMQPNFAPAYNALGLALKMQGADAQQIIYYLNKAVELDPNFLPTYDNLGKMYYSLGDIDRAEESFQKGLSLDPENESIQLSLGWIYLLGQNDPDKAMPYFSAAASKHNAVMGYFGKGICYMSKDKRMEVMDVVTQLRGLNQEALARDLETMLRENRSIVREQEFPTANSYKTGPSSNTASDDSKAQSPSNPADNAPEPSSTDQSEYNEQGELKVRLRGKLP